MNTNIHTQNIHQVKNPLRNYCFSLPMVINLLFFSFTVHTGGPHTRRIVIALYNYNAREETDVSFVKGDRMEVLDDTESDWWRVQHLTTRAEGLIPWNFVAEERSVNSEE
jgi:hypothetical protein